MPALEVTPDGWLVPGPYWNYFRFITSHDPPRPGAAWFQLRVDAVHWKPVAFWIVGGGLVAAGVATGLSPVVFAGTTVLGAWLAMYWVTVGTIRNCPAGVGVVIPVISKSGASRGLRGKAMMADRRLVPVGIPPTIVEGVMVGGERAEVLFLHVPESTACLVLAARPLVGRGNRPPAPRLPPAPGLLADAPDVRWDDAARRVLAGVAAEAGEAEYLSTCHLLLAAARHCPEAVGVDYAAVRASAGAGEPATPAAAAAADEQWPTPRLRRVVAQAAAQAEAASRPVNPRDLWYALLTDPDAECRVVLDALGITAAALRSREFRWVQEHPFNR